MLPGWSIVAILAAFALFGLIYMLVGAIVRKLLPPTHPLQGRLGIDGSLMAAAWTVRYLQWLLVAVIVGGGLLVTVIYS